MRLVVVGDSLLDVDLVGEVGRLAPDTPVPVVDVTDRRRAPGGAALVAAMLRDDGHDVRFLTHLGGDAAGESVLDLLDGVTVHATRHRAPTPVKTRVGAKTHAFVRFDEGSHSSEIPAVDDAALAELDRADAVVVADYGGGMSSNRALRERLAAITPRTPVVWDPHPRGTAPVAGAAMVVPNAKEAGALTGIDTSTLAGAATAGERLRIDWDVQCVAVTRDSHGAVVCTCDSSGAPAVPFVVPTEAVPGGDPRGAGDRFAATLGAHLAQGDTHADACTAAVAAATAFVRGDTGLLPPGESSMHPRKAADVAERVRAHGGTVVATGGCFDILHAGHARTLEAARALGDCLVVLINSDESVRRLKGPSRPIMPEQQRADLLRSLACVDAVVIFDEDTPLEALTELKPDVWVKGGDYAGKTLAEAAALDDWGGHVVTVPYVPDTSTTKFAAALARGD